MCAGPFTCASRKTELGNTVEEPQTTANRMTQRSAAEETSRARTRFVRPVLVVTCTTSVELEAAEEELAVEEKKEGTN